MGRGAIMCDGGTVKLEREAAALEEPTAALELAFIQQFLKGYRLSHPLVREEAEREWREAVQYAALRLEEVAARAHMVEGLHEQSSM
jgi:hypothetical protein